MKYIVLLLLLASFVAAAPVGTEEVRTAGNTGFTDLVYDDVTGEVAGWVRYSIEGKKLHTTWVLDNAKPGFFYQLKVHSLGEDTRLADACDDTAYCGTHLSGDSYLVMDTEQANPKGKVRGGVQEERLPAGDYDDMFFVITESQDPWPSGSTYAGAKDLSDFMIR